MLVLTRKAGESLIVPDMGLTITVVSIKGNSVRLGFDAPSGLPIYRQEVHDRINGEVIRQERQEGGANLKS